MVNLGAFGAWQRSFHTMPHLPLCFSVFLRSNVRSSHLQYPWRIHGAGIYTNIDWGYIDGIHVTIYSSTMDPMGYHLQSSAQSIHSPCHSQLLLFLFGPTYFFHSVACISCCDKFGGLAQSPSIAAFVVEPTAVVICAACTWHGKTLTPLKFLACRDCRDPPSAWEASQIMFHDCKHSKTLTLLRSLACRDCRDPPSAWEAWQISRLLSV